LSNRAYIALGSNIEPEINLPRSVAVELKDGVLAQIENQLERVRTANKNAPRTIDLDIALFNRDVFKVGERHVPDPEILEFGHIALPLADLDPDYRHPETGQTLAEIAAPFADDPDLWVRPDIQLMPPGG
jgi:7,8-dihydro-6-hydroxymethylpterin-pyrophosphokinase